MRKLRDVLRLKAEGLKSRQIAASLGLGQSTIIDYLGRARRAGLGWPLPDELTDTALEALLFPPEPAVPRDERPIPDWPTIYRELKRPGVTLQLLWQEYRGAHSNGYGYSRFCERYRAWEGRLTPVMRQTHIAGEKLFVDYAGTTIDIYNAETGEVHACQLFVVALGASSFTYAEATWAQSLPDWIGSHTRAFDFFGGVAAMTVHAAAREAVGAHDRTHRRAVPPRHRKPTTVREHMPSSHQRYADWTPERLTRRAGEIGRNTATLVEIIMRERTHPEQGF